MRIAKYEDMKGDYIGIWICEFSNRIIFEPGSDNELTFNKDDLLDMIHDLQRFYNQIKSRETKENSIKKTPKLPTK